MQCVEIFHLVWTLACSEFDVNKFLRSKRKPWPRKNLYYDFENLLEIFVIRYTKFVFISRN